MKIPILSKLFWNHKVFPPNSPNVRQAKVYKQDKVNKLARKSTHKGT